jgi:hypothetical protein
VPTKRIAKFTKSYNEDDVQAMTSTACGYFSVYAGKNIIAGKDPYHGLTNNPQQNERILENYFSQQ